MENNPKKSKALIITIIVIVVLLVAGYFIWKNSDSILGTKSGGNIFSPLLGTSKPKDIKPIDSTQNNGGENPDTNSNQNNGDGNVDSEVGNGSAQIGNGSIVPPSKPLPAPNTDNYVATSTTGPKPTTAPTPTTTEEPPKICQITADDELQYTEAEKDELTELLRQYYLIAPELKSSEEVALLNADIQRNQDLIDHADILTGQCKEQKADPNYTGPKAIKNNPYYADFNRAPDFFAPSEYHSIEDLLNIW